MTVLGRVGRRPLRLGIATETGVDWIFPADPIRIRGADLRQVAGRAAATRQECPGVEVVIDVEFVVADTERIARDLPRIDCPNTDDQTILYVGTPAGLAGLIADIYAIDIADGAVLIPLIPGGGEVVRESVVPCLETMSPLLTPCERERTA